MKNKKESLIELQVKHQLASHLISELASTQTPLTGYTPMVIFPIL